MSGAIGDRPRPGGVDLGYMAKRSIKAPAFYRARGLRLIESVSGCVCGTFGDFLPLWRHNGWWFFDSVDVLTDVGRRLGVETAGMPAYFYRGDGREFDETKRRWRPIAPEPGVRTAPVPPGPCRRVGYDVVGFSCGNTPECSPLTCNHLFERTVVNQSGLFGEADTAYRLLEEGFFDHSEPGPFRVIEVNRLDGSWSGR